MDWGNPIRQRQQPAIVQKTFVIADQPTRAMLRVGADFCVASVTLNGDAVLSSTPYDLPIPVPAHRSCMIGDNILAVRIAGTGGPAAVAVELALTYPDGKTQLIRSDASWECVAREVASKHVNIQTFGRVDQEAWWGIRSRPSTDAFDEYNPVVRSSRPINGRWISQASITGQICGRRSLSRSKRAGIVD